MQVGDITTEQSCRHAWHMHNDGGRAEAGAAKVDAEEEAKAGQQEGVCVLLHVGSL
jgi:hypothetical protein